MLHRRWSPKVALPVGPLWGKTEEYGVAGCMTWHPADSPSTYDRAKWDMMQKQRQSAGLVPRHPHHVNHYQGGPPRATDVVQFDPRLEDTYASRATGCLKVRPPTATYVDTDKKYFYTSTGGAGDEVVEGGGVEALRGPYYEDDVIAAVRQHTAAVREHTRDSSLLHDPAMTPHRPPRPPSATHRRGPTPTHRAPRRVEFQDTVRTGRSSRPPTPGNGYYTPKVTGRTNDELGLWQDVVDDLLLQKAEDELLIESLATRNGTAVSSRPGVRYAAATPPPPATPLLKTQHHRHTYTKTEGAPVLDAEHRWLMSKYRRTARPKVDSHWDKDPLHRTTSDNRPESRVKVNFDCPDDSDMVVSVKVHNNKPFRY